MPFCKNCGAEIAENTAVCPKCGAAQQPVQSVQPGQPTQPPVVDNGGFGWGLLGFCIPLVGLILFLVWKDTKPKTSRAAGIGALVCVIFTVVMYILAAVLGVFAAMLS